MKRFVTALAAGMFGMTIGVAVSNGSAFGAEKTKVNCDAVMQELNNGKKTREVAKDLSISPSSIYRCKKKEIASAKTAPKAGSEAAASPVASPAAAAPGPVSHK